MIRDRARGRPGIEHAVDLGIGPARARSYGRRGSANVRLFLPEQPDLDWSNPDVRRAMHDVLRFWLDRGVDGFQVDVVHGLGKDPRLPDLAPELAAIPRAALNDEESTHEILRALRRPVDAYPGDRVLVGDVLGRRLGALGGDSTSF